MLEQTTVYIARHGQSKNISVNGVDNNTQLDVLTEAGVDHAITLAQNFTGISLDNIYSSDSSVAIQTAEIIANSTQAPFSAHEELREIDLPQHSPELPEEDFNPHKKVGTKSSEEDAIRFREFLLDQVFIHTGGRILVISHERIINSFLTLIDIDTSNNTPEVTVFKSGTYIVLESDCENFQVPSSDITSPSVN